MQPGEDEGRGGGGAAERARRGRELRRDAASNIFLLYFTIFIIIVSYCLPAFKNLYYKS